MRIEFDHKNKIVLLWEGRSFIHVMHTGELFGYGAPWRFNLKPPVVEWFEEEQAHDQQDPEQGC